MSLPTKDEVCQLSYAKDGVPFVNVAGNSGITTLGLSYGRNGVPFLAVATPLEAPVGQNGYVTLGVMS